MWTHHSEPTFQKICFLPSRVKNSRVSMIWLMRWNPGSRRVNGSLGLAWHMNEHEWHTSTATSTLYYRMECPKENKTCPKAEGTGHRWNSERSLGSNPWTCSTEWAAPFPPQHH